MKKIFSALLMLMLVFSFTACMRGEKPTDKNTASGSDIIKFSSSSEASIHTSPESPAAGESTEQKSNEVRAVWISYLELQDLMTGQSEDEFRDGISEMLTNCKDFGLNTVIFHVRPFGDAVYPSEIFPQSYLFTGEEGGVGKAPYDALAIAIEEAHKHNLRLEAWINPYRVRSKGDKRLDDDNPANDMLKSGDAVKMGEVITFNPASVSAQDLIVSGVTEIVANYDVDAVHFDDYFYPTTDTAFDSKDYRDYKSSGGTKSLEAWRRSNVTTLIRRVHDAIKVTKPTVLFGISPQGNMDNNLNKQFVDVKEIIKAGLIDYICPQIYFGFENSSCPYAETIKDFNDMAKGTSIKVYAGLAAYKFGITDKWAGAGKDEWIGTTDILSRQVQSARALSCYGGVALYRYDSIFNYKNYFSEDKVICTQAESEFANLKKLFYNQRENML